MKKPEKRGDDNVTTKLKIRKIWGRQCPSCNKWYTHSPGLKNPGCPYCEMKNMGKEHYEKIKKAVEVLAEAPKD